jgi:DNA-directed RNA polymerase subunit RPC12/RpoP
VSENARYRCTSCGNLTRFDVTATRRTKAYHHYTVGGELAVEDEQVLEETVEAVECRWCGSAGRVEAIDDADAPVDASLDQAAEG